MNASGRIASLQIGSPKRSGVRRGWEGFFPYYAGYPLSFAERVLASARLDRNATVLDPWNGSGTTTAAAASLGLSSIGFDINPVMIAVAKARLLSRTEADSLIPLARSIIDDAQDDNSFNPSDDQLLNWFMPQTAAMIRHLESSIRRRLVGERTFQPDGVHLDQMSGIAAAFYCALFVLSRDLVRCHESSNPTWLRTRIPRTKRVRSDRSSIESKFLRLIRQLSDELVATQDIFGNEQAAVIALRDSRTLGLPPNSVDVLLSSPPYCTRIDYTAATRIELAVLSELLPTSVGELSHQMLGSIRVPKEAPEAASSWGSTCLRFLDRVRNHPSKASATYYLKTHLDYFNKLHASIVDATASLKSSGIMVLVVQDSYYKEVHNDLPTIVAEMASNAGADLLRREDFSVKRTLGGINPGARRYRAEASATESVLCLRLGA